MRNEKPVHFYDRAKGENGIAQIACGKSVGIRQRWSPEWKEVSCYECAWHAAALTDAQRNHIWQNTNERLRKYKITPWPVPDGRSRHEARRPGTGGEAVRRRASLEAARA